MYSVASICYLFSCQVLSVVLTTFLSSFLFVKQKVDHRGIRTPTLLIRSQTPYPLGHAVMCTVNCICYFFSCQVLSPFLRSFLCVKQNVDHCGIRTPIFSFEVRRLIRWALRPCICYLISCQLLFFLMTRFLKSFLCVKQKVDDSGIRTPNRLIRSQTPYPLGHAARCPVNCICYLFSCQVLSLVLTLFLRSFLCVKQKVDLRGIRTPNLLIRSQTPYPLGHASCQLYLLLVQLPIVVPYIDILCKNFPLCQTNCRTERNSNPQSSESKSDALSVVQCDHVSCQLYLLLVQLPSVVSYIDILCKNFPLCQTKCRTERESNPQSSDSNSDALSVVKCGHVSCQLYVTYSVAKCCPLC